MKRAFRAISVAATLAMVAGLVIVPAQTASAASVTYTVQVGQFHGYGANCDPQTFQHCIGAEGQHFFAPRTVHKGDILHFVGGGFDTASLLPANEDLEGWIAANATFPGQPYALASSDPDEGALGLKFTNAVFFPSSFSCGVAQQPCDYDGNSVVNSGVPQGDSMDFYVQVNANPGDYFYIDNLIVPRMHQRVQVVPESTATPTQAEIDAGAAAQDAQDQDEGAALVAKLKRQTSHQGSSGKVVDSYVGYDTHDLAIMGIFPSKLNLDKGQTVRYHFAQDEYFAHTMTFPLAQGLDISSHLGELVCDPDGDNGPGPDTEAQPAPPFCAGGFDQVELDIPEHFVTTEGNGILTSATDFESSGFRGGSVPKLGPTIGGNGSWDLRFTKKGVFRGLCLVHPEMRQKVTVD